jgi:hypothetical protein
MTARDCVILLECIGQRMHLRRRPIHVPAHRRGVIVLGGGEIGARLPADIRANAVRLIHVRRRGLIDMRSPRLVEVRHHGLLEVRHHRLTEVRRREVGRLRRRHDVAAAVLRMCRRRQE